MSQPYGEKLLANIVLVCERRGIPAQELDSVLAHIGEAAGTPVLEMEEPELRRVQQGLGDSLTDYLDGDKRRGGGPPGAFSNAEPEAIKAAAIAGISIGDVEGTGKDGRVKAKDVAAALEADAEE